VDGVSLGIARQGGRCRPIFACRTTVLPIARSTRAAALGRGAPCRGTRPPHSAAPHLAAEPSRRTRPRRTSMIVIGHWGYINENPIMIMKQARIDRPG
jgi:hypothetical protein